MNRAYYIDRLRILLTVLVIFHHSAIAFGASGGWYYVTPHATSGLTQQTLSLFMAINQAFFMSFFFFISALFMPSSFDRKGFGKFLKDRFVRLGIPLLVYTLLIHPTLVYGIFKYLGKETGSWLHFVWIIDTKYSEPGPMWFVLTLLIFEIVYAFYRKYFRFLLPVNISGKLPSSMSIVLFIIITGLLAYGIRFIFPVGTSIFGLQLGYFVLYIAMYALGIIAGRKNWIDRMPLQKAKPWFIASLVAIPALAVAIALTKSPEAAKNFMGGFNVKALLYAMWEPVICVGFCYYLLMLFKKHWNKPNKFILSLSADSYTTYIFHPLIVVGYTFLSEKIDMPPLARLAFVLILGIPSCFLVAHLIRKIPGAKRVL